MKKIILIDDNKDKACEKYGAGYVNVGIYNSVLNVFHKLSLADDLGFLNDAACVLLHKTLNDYFDGRFHEDSQMVQAIIRDMPSMGDTVPLVLFSDGDTSNFGDYHPDSPNMIYSLSKRAFYSRLQPFLDCYQKTGAVDLKILAYGTDYNKVLVSQYSKTLFQHLQEYDNGDALPVSLLLCSEMENIVSLAQPSIGLNFEDLINLLQIDNITVGDFKKKINTIVENIQEYGKNYYHWD